MSQLNPEKILGDLSYQIKRYSENEELMPEVG